MIKQSIFVRATHREAQTSLLCYLRLQNEQERGGDMPRAPSEKVVEAEKLFKKGIAMVEIAKKLGVSDGTVRSWKNRYKWGGDSKKNKCNVAKKSEKTNATLQKKKRGGQPGNQNAKGGSGNPNPKPPPDVTKHGAYSKVYWDVLDDDERVVIDGVPTDEVDMLLEQIQLFTVRERRIMQAINKYRNTKEPVAIFGVVRTESKRTFKNEREEEQYNRRVEKDIKAEKRYPGNVYDIETTTTTTNKDTIIVRLEQELSSVQNKKTKAIAELSKIKLERAKMESGNAGNDVVDDWIAAVLGEEVESSG